MANNIDLSVDFCGVKFKNPFLLSSSPVSNSAEMVARSFDAGWSGVVFKTLNSVHGLYIGKISLNLFHKNIKRFIIIQIKCPEAHTKTVFYYRQVLAAEAETVHALNHLREMGGIRSTRENLDEAINGESYEFQKMYPQMIEDAKSEKNEGALKSFAYANAVEKTHAGLYTKALESLGRNQETDYYVCQVCGHTAEGEAPDTCPVCQSKKQAFKKVA